MCSLLSFRADFFYLPPCPYTYTTPYRTPVLAPRTGWLAASTTCDYADALRRNNPVTLLVTEAAGAVSPGLSAILCALGKQPLSMPQAPQREVEHERLSEVAHLRAQVIILVTVWSVSGSCLDRVRIVSGSYRVLF